MTTVDLSRIPEVYRERVQRLVTAAREATIARCSADDVERAVQGAERATLAPFLAIAVEADEACNRAADEARRSRPIDSDREQRAFDRGVAARAEVWARRLAEREATLAATFAPLPRPSPEAQPEPPPSYWSTGIAVERKATTAQPVFPVRFTGEDDAARLYGVLLGIQINFPRAIGVLGDRLEPILEALRGPAAPEVEEVPPDPAADAEQAVRAAQRAHLDATAKTPSGFVLDPPPARLSAVRPAPDRPYEVRIHDADGLRLALDGLLRYLADKPAAAVRAVAELVKTLPVGLCPSVTLAANNGRAFDLLASFPGAKTESRDIPPSTSVWVTVDGVDFGAAVARRPTPLERAHTAIELLPAAKRHQALRRLSRSYSAPEMCVKHDACRIIGDEVVWPDGERWPTDPDRLQTVQP